VVVDQLTLAQFFLVQQGNSLRMYKYTNGSLKQSEDKRRNYTFAGVER
jgi:hypothetical protein